SIGVVEATGRIIIKPSWNKTRARDRGKIVLHIDPKMSFGTGHHESTRLSLTLLERYIEPNADVLDFGTGTGILAIAAVKLGARRVTAIDYDEWSIPNARENIKKNGARRNIRLVRGTAKAIPRTKFNLAIANIDYPTIVDSLPKLLAAVRHEGILILSGLLLSDLNALFDTFRHKSALPLELVTENGWAALALLKCGTKGSP
ncbi:MAG: 50S ribosomal protein L11 methyltransferase, partial [Bacteroidota bacterium]